MNILQRKRELEKSEQQFARFSRSLGGALRLPRSTFPSTLNVDFGEAGSGMSMKQKHTLLVLSGLIVGYFIGKKKK